MCHESSVISCCISRSAAGQLRSFDCKSRFIVFFSFFCIVSISSHLLQLPFAFQTSTETRFLSALLHDIMSESRLTRAQRVFEEVGQSYLCVWGRVEKKHVEKMNEVARTVGRDLWGNLT